MANREHLAKIKKGVAAWNDWRKTNKEIVPHLSGADLYGADLSMANLSTAQLGGAYLTGANLSRADLSGADVSEASLVGTNLSGAKLIGANLSEANLSLAKLRGANLFGAHLSRADLSGANLVGADLSRASVSDTIFRGNDLSDVKGLETVRHDGPSMIGIDTIYRSHGKIPPKFLRGAGVPENFIEYMGSLAGKALEFYSCFISYSTKDQEFADRLHADLQNKGVRCWFAPHDIQAGKKIHEQIDEAIRRYERLLLILSPNSMNSEWVKTEIRKARKRERTEKNRVLFPVRLISFEAIRDWELFDADEGKDLAVEIREYYIPDFSNWKNHDSFAKEFKKLLRDLKAEGSKAA
jgi:uncharacterized protein YjbI with pentapeptide repeats